MTECKNLELKLWPACPSWTTTGCSEVAITARCSFPRPSSPCKKTGMQQPRRLPWSVNTSWESPLASLNFCQKSSNIAFHNLSWESLSPPRIGWPSVFLKIHSIQDVMGNVGQGIITERFFHRTGRSRSTIFTGNVMLNRWMSVCKFLDQCEAELQLRIFESNSLFPGKLANKTQGRLISCMRIVVQCPFHICSSKHPTTARQTKIGKQLSHGDNMPSRISLRATQMHTRR